MISWILKKIKDSLLRAELNEWLDPKWGPLTQEHYATYVELYPE